MLHLAQISCRRFIRCLGVVIIIVNIILLPSRSTATRKKGNDGTTTSRCSRHVSARILTCRRSRVLVSKMMVEFLIVVSSIIVLYRQVARPNIIYILDSVGINAVQNGVRRIKVSPIAVLR